MDGKLLIIIDKLKLIEHRLTVIESILSPFQVKLQTPEIDGEVIVFYPKLTNKT